MRSNSNKTTTIVKNSKIEKLIKQIGCRIYQRLNWEMRLTAGYLSFGMEMRQWMAMLLICLILLPMFVAPVNALSVLNNKSSAAGETSEFEPVNTPQPFWKSAETFIKLKLEDISSSISSPVLYNDNGDEIEDSAKTTKVSKTGTKKNKKNEDSVKSIKNPKSEGIPKTKKNLTADDQITSDPQVSFIEKSGKGISTSGKLSESNPLPEKNTVAVPDVSPTPDPTPYPMPGRITSGSGNLRPDPSVSPTPDPEPSPTPSVWTESQWRSQFTADNNLGNPSGQASNGFVSPGVAGATRDRTKTTNFSFNLPIVSIPGRGLNASVGMTYNSQIWNKSDNSYTYNIDRNWLSPGFNLSYGYLDYAGFGTNGGFDVISPDGTRHLLLYKGTTPGGEWSIYESTDGDFVQTYSTGISALGGPSNVWVRFSDGTNIGYGEPDNFGRRYATTVIDRNGNYLTISYLQNSSPPNTHGGRIDKIVDTLGREIIFNYDNNPNVAEKKLLSISVPGLGGENRIEVIRFFYENVPFQPQGRFDGTIGVFGQTTVPATLNVLRYVYFPGTKMGYKYDYSTHFGMIYKITQLAGMQVSETGVTNDGQWVNWTKYNYPGTNGTPPGSSLSDVPKYNQRTDEWQGRNQTTPYIHTYQVTDSDLTHDRTTRVVMPDGNISETKTIWKPSTDVNGVFTDYWDDGLIKESSLLDGSENVLRKQIYEWQEGTQTNGRKNPRLKSLVSVNETGQSTKTVYLTYDGYNNPTEVIEYGFADANGNRPELKRIKTTYVTISQYIELNLIHLPEKIEVYADGGTVAVSKVIYEYDDYQNILASYPAAPPNITNRPDAIRLRNESNPFINHSFQVCNSQGCVTVLVEYIQDRIKGNLTKVTNFADASIVNDPNASVTTTKYDVLGNADEAGVNCCRQKVWEYLKSTEYAYPTKVTKGTDVQLVSKAEYDLWTGLVTKTKDENNQPTVYEYEPDTLRQSKVTYPNGGYTLTEYSDKLVSDPAQTVPGYVRTKTTLESNKIVEGYSYFNGRGASIRSGVETPDGWSVSAVEYDSLGRALKTFNPFYAAAPTDPVPNTVKWTEVVNYDQLSRATKVKLPDGSFAESFFNEAVVSFTDADNQLKIGIASRAKDQADKERRQIVDALGRIIRVDEPTSSGLGSAATPNQPTFYSYDGNDNLAKTVQIEGSVRQERRFKYDSLSRLTNEKQVEATPRLDDNGVYGAPAPNKWTKVLKYDNFGRMTEATDARGVKTSFTQYDGLNRLKTVTFSDGTPEIRYSYDQARTGFFNKGALTRVETAPNATNPHPDTPDTASEFDYDQMGRVRQHRQSIGAQNYNLEYNYNLAGQMTSEKYPSGKLVSMNYDNGGRLSGINDQGRTYLSGLQFGLNGGAVSAMTLGNGVQESFDYNDNLQMNKMSWAKDGTVIQRYDYTFGEMNSQNQLKNNGKLAQIDSYNGGSVSTPTKQFTQKFGYDAVGRLKTETETRGDNNQQSYKQTFDYDRFGNRYLKAADNQTSQNPLLPTPIEANNIDKTSNRLATNTGTVYDDAGNVTTDNKFRSLKYSYDANGRMYKTSTMDDLNQSNSVYDASGQRVAQQINGVWKFFVYDAGGKMVAEYGGTPSTDEGGVKYIHQDAQGSTRAITSASGAVKARSDYAAFGEEINSSIGQRTAQGYTSSDSLRQKYAQTERDEASGLDHTWFRKNENRAGRWTSPDPYNGSMSLGDPQSFNRYSYVENQPTNFVDPSGLNAASFFCYDIVTTGHYTNDPSHVYTHTETVCSSFGGGGSSGGGSSGGGTGGEFGGGGNENIDDDYSDCVHFVLQIAADTSGGDLLAAGRVYGAMSRNYYSKSKDGNGNNVFGISGFLSKFTSGGQGADVYKHVAGALGATLIGNNRVDPSGISGETRTGNEVFNAQNEEDRKQENNPTPNHTAAEAQAELAGNAAGQKIAYNIQSITQNSRDRKVNFNKIMNAAYKILCDF